MTVLPEKCSPAKPGTTPTNFETHFCPQFFGKTTSAQTAVLTLQQVVGVLQEFFTAVLVSPRFSTLWTKAHAHTA